MDTKTDDIGPDQPVISTPPHPRPRDPNLGTAIDPVIAPRPPRRHRPELDVYDTHRDALIRDHLGEWVVICGTELIGVMPTEEEANRLAVDRCDLAPVMIRQITSEEDPVIHYAHDLP